MELTAEQKQRIEQEEVRRHAEESYRAGVRASLASAPATRRWSFPVILLAVIGAFAVMMIALLVGDRLMRKSSTGSATRLEHFSTSIGNGSVQVGAQDATSYKITVTPDMRSVQFTGKFRATGGSGNDINVVILSDTEYPNWINGHRADAYYASGKKTVGNFSLALSPGTYYLVLSNKFSLLTSKHVDLKATLTYTKIVSN